jgi:hypothetical protein
VSVLVRVGNWKKVKTGSIYAIGSNENLSKAQYEKFIAKGLSDEHILAKYLDLMWERLEMAKKRWGIA